MTATDRETTVSLPLRFYAALTSERLDAIRFEALERAGASPSGDRLLEYALLADALEPSVRRRRGRLELGASELAALARISDDAIAPIRAREAAGVLALIASTVRVHLARIEAENTGH
jgi:hypothetical protein